MRCSKGCYNERCVPDGLSDVYLGIDRTPNAPKLSDTVMREVEKDIVAAELRLAKLEIASFLAKAESLRRGWAACGPVAILDDDEEQ